jgi:hypothetical protein
MAAPIIAAVLGGAARILPAIASAGGRAAASGAVRAGAKPGGFAARAANTVGRHATYRAGNSVLSAAQNAADRRQENRGRR